MSESPQAVVAELADALDSGSSARKGMEVQVLSTAFYPRLVKLFADGDFLCHIRLGGFS